MPPPAKPTLVISYPNCLNLRQFVDYWDPMRSPVGMRWFLVQRALTEEEKADLELAHTLATNEVFDDDTLAHAKKLHSWLTFHECTERTMRFPDGLAGFYCI
jgi:hypothetical protein